MAKEQSPHVEETQYELEEYAAGKTSSKLVPAAIAIPITVDDFVDVGDLE